MDATPVTVTNNAADNYLQSFATLDSDDMGHYTVSVDFNGREQTATKTLYVRATNSIQFTLEDVSNNLKNQRFVTLGHPVTVICDFVGDPLGAITWTKDDAAATAADMYESATTTTDFTVQSTLKILTVTDASSNGMYKCASQYASDSTDVSKSLALVVLGATALASDNVYADLGETANVKCDYIAHTGDDTPATWTFPNPADSAVTTGDTTTSSTSSKALTGLEFADNGEVACIVTYSNALTNTLTVTQYVRGTHVANPIARGTLATTATLTCVVYGDAQNGPTVWTANSATVADGEKHQISADAYSEYATNNYLTVKDLATDDDDVIYTCTSTYTHSTGEAGDTTTATQTLHVLSKSSRTLF